MEIYVFRHGIAADAQAGRSDAIRELTEEGREKTAAVVRLARKSGLDPSLILSSPYVRALQTARIAADELGYKEGILQTKVLVPEGSPETVWSELRAHGDENAILVAGHEPLLSQVVAYLLVSPALQIHMKKAAMVRIDLHSVSAAPRGVLRWMITPAMVG